MKVINLIKTLRDKCPPNAEVYVEVDFGVDVPAEALSWQNGTLRFKIEDMEVYEVGVFPKLKIIDF